MPFGNLIETLGTIVIGLLAAIGTLSFTLSKVDWFRRKTIEFAHDSSLERMKKMNDFMEQRLDACDADREALRMELMGLQKTLRRLNERIEIVEVSTMEMRKPADLENIKLNNSD